MARAKTPACCLIPQLLLAVKGDVSQTKTDASILQAWSESKSDASPGFSSKLEVEAHVVTLRDAARPGDEGLLLPLLRKWHDG